MTNSSTLAHPSAVRTTDQTIERSETRLDRLSDAQLCEVVAASIAKPKAAPADSFVLHAPLELLARCALLPLCRPAARRAARERLDGLGRAYAAAGAEIAEPRPRVFARAGDALAELCGAIEAGELDDADAAAAWLACHLTPLELARGLAADVIPRLGAAAHGSIFLYQLPRVAPRSAAAARMLRGLVRELALEHDWKLGWQSSRAPGVRASDDLIARLRRPPSPGDPGSNFIFPTMALVEQSGLAAQLLDAPTRSLDPQAANRALSRVAAWSMLQDDAVHAPYGWSHCLTLPQAVLGIADACGDPAAAVAVAATFVLGFRATLGRVDIDSEWEPERSPRRDQLAPLAGTPSEAAAAAWHAPMEAVAEVVAELASRAALHGDAHLVKYTLACFDAAHLDAAAARLYLAAAAYLSAWWGQQPEP